MPYSEKQIAEWAEETWAKLPADSFTFNRRAIRTIESAARTLIAAVRKETREECAREMGPKIYHACGKHQHLPVWIPSASTFIPMIVCPHCEAAIRNLQEREEGKT